MKTIQERLRSFKFDKDNMPRMASETIVPVGLASEAADTIDDLSESLHGVVSLMDKFIPKSYIPENETWENIPEVENARAILAKLKGDDDE